MEINITKFYNAACPKDYSASVAEIGNNAGVATWQAATDDSEDYMMLDTEDKRIEFRQYVRGFGAWDDKEISRWTDRELNALLIQMISSDIRESCLDDNRNAWEEYEQSDNAGRLFKGTDGEIYYYIGD